MATDLVYARPSDNIAGLGVRTTSGIAGTTPIANISDSDPASVVTWTGAPAWWIKWDMSAVSGYSPVQWLVFLGMDWLFNATRNLTFQANTSDSFAAPPISQPITLPVDDGSAFPRGLAFDLSEVAGYTAAHDWIRILFADNDVGGVPPTVGDIFMTSTLRTLRPLGLGWRQRPAYPGVVHFTPALRRLAYSQEVRQFHVSGRQHYTDAEWAQIRLLADETRGAITPFPVQTDPDDDPMLVTLEDLQHDRPAPDVHDVALTFLEVVNDRVA